MGAELNVKSLSSVCFDLKLSHDLHVFNMQFRYVSRCSVTNGASRKVSVGGVDPKAKKVSLEPCSLLWCVLPSA